MKTVDREKLWESYQKNPVSEIREQIIIEYAPLVKLVAGRLSMYLGYNVEYEDLVTFNWDCQFRYSSSDTPSSLAISSSNAVFPVFISIFFIASSIFFCFWRTALGIQSILRIWSNIAPRIRRLAYFSNLTSLLRSNLSIASISPKIP